ncbi:MULTISPECIES: hypothetical protein [unclassified Streptomyces]|uniref:hypothetical protein n=1 Tax=unclassified Streptomyces TaxID=2593676 RepID=UPI0008864697|nr:MULTISPECIES: hypothetical protein [unclassified Streptomyces]PBC85824.1 hypothetical protein BX261_5849 [Streptomyces sp. 2321.6]SDR04977.1 hypothetical protein SAMN05216511_1413 [Streptomyces sp. KS_16]SED80148.1 hypothetical protein SAMN05428940_5875 [Streptomyces sp. 2133.1]SNC72702.1 hypothetical protein SAMN06272741_5775 [Streptomyces sp. 2114.4]
MFEVRKSIKRFREDPAWAYHKHGRDFLDTFDRLGYPFSLGSDGVGIRDLVQGSFHGQEVSLFHVLAWKRCAKSSVAWNYSVAVLPLLRALPSTAATARRLNVPDEKIPALNRVTGRGRDLPNLGTHLVRYCADDPDFAALISTYAMERVMHDARLAWRIEGDRIIGWTYGRKTYEDILTLAETLAAIVDDFPEEAWNWPQQQESGSTPRHGPGKHRAPTREGFIRRAADPSRWPVGRQPRHQPEQADD